MLGEEKTEALVVVKRGLDKRRSLKICKFINCLDNFLC